MRILLLLIVAVAVAGYFTRPGADAHWKTVAALIQQGKVDGGTMASRGGAFEDFYVVTKYVFSTGGRPQVECWGAFTRFLCVEPGGTEKLDAPA